MSFVQADLATLEPGGLLDLRNAVFRHLHEPTLATLVPDDPDLKALRPARAVEGDPVVALARGLLGRVQAALRAGIAALDETGSWEPFGLGQPRGPAWSIEKTDGGLVRAYVGSWFTITIATAADLLIESWPRLRRCACGVRFRPTHGHQKFHDQKCAGLARWHTHARKRRTRNYKQELVTAHRRTKSKKGER